MLCTHTHPQHHAPKQKQKKTVKVRLQTSSYRGPIDCLRQLLAKEGAHALFKGMSSPLLTASLVNAVVFSSYNEAMAVRFCVLTFVAWHMRLHRQIGPNQPSPPPSKYSS